tara:strand:- start:971 stop:1078 length:108 start_codon:yes stop_codon:yes gene_type:complete
MRIDDDIYARVSPASFDQLISELYVPAAGNAGEKR